SRARRPASRWIFQLSSLCSGVADAPPSEGGGGRGARACGTIRSVVYFVVEGPHLSFNPPPRSIDINCLGTSRTAGWSPRSPYDRRSSGPFETCRESRGAIHVSHQPRCPCLLPLHRARPRRTRRRSHAALREGRRRQF